MSNPTFSADFERHEKKYMLTEGQLDALIPALAPHMQADAYGRYSICSLYYDTDDYSLIRRSLDKPVYKEKLRLRSYGPPAPGDTVFLELKKKLRGVTYKRRIALPHREAADYLDRGLPPRERGQIFGEIDSFVRRSALGPKVLISYDRVALTDREDRQLRLTVDSELRFRSWDLDMTLGDYGFPLLPADRFVVEIKTFKALPLWLCKILSELHAYPVSFSKYGTAYSQCLAGRTAMHPEVIRYAG